jgi:putative nucleotidyltransferase with HDIG domain
VAQFFRALWAPLLPIDAVYVRRHLDPALWRLFQTMARAEQHHGVAVCRALEAQGHDDPDLLVAALLHDVGKSVAPLHLWERVGVVLGEHVLPRAAARWREGPLHGLRRGFVVRYRHPAWGAALARRAGASERAVTLIGRHHAKPGESDPALRALQQVDEG